jgi:hypothetical protein
MCDQNFKITFTPNFHWRCPKCDLNNYIELKANTDLAFLNENEPLEDYDLTEIFDQGSISIELESDVWMGPKSAVCTNCGFNFGLPSFSVFYNDHVDENGNLIIDEEYYLEEGEYDEDDDEDDMPEFYSDEDGAQEQDDRDSAQKIVESTPQSVTFDDCFKDASFTVFCVKSIDISQ